MMLIRRVLVLLTAVGTVFAATSCTLPEDVGVVQLSGSTMGTTYRVVYAARAASPGEVQQAVDSLLGEINQSLSTYIDTSLISQINASSDTSAWHPIDSHFEAVFRRARFVYGDTSGAFNPAVGPLVDAWGFGPAGPGAMPESTTIESLLLIVDFDLFDERDSPPAVQKSSPAAQLDFNAIAKGYGVDAVGQLLELRGVESYLVEIGGEVRTRGDHPSGRAWSVGIERPDEDASGHVVQTVLLLNDAALATSGNYRNFTIRDGRKYAHILNPETGYPEESPLLSASVLAEDCMTADAYATALMVMGLEQGMDFVEARDWLEAYFIADGGEGQYLERRSTGFPTPE